MAPPKKRASRASPRNTGKKKVEVEVEETPAQAPTAMATAASSSATITVANKKHGPSSIADSEEPSSSPLSTPSESPEEPRSLTSESEVEQREPQAKEMQPLTQLAAPRMATGLAAPPAYVAINNTSMFARPTVPEPEPAPQRLGLNGMVQDHGRQQPLTPSPAVHGPQAGPSGSNNVIIIDDNDDAAPSNVAPNRPEFINGHASRPSNTDVGRPIAMSQNRLENNEVGHSIAKFKDRLEAVRIPQFDPTAGNPGRNTAGYEYSNLEEITIRQLREDIHAYNHDRRWCEEMLLLDDVTPAEVRTYQLRILDISHQIRYCNHRIENIELQARRTMQQPSRGPQYSYNQNQKAIAAPQRANGYAAPTNENRAAMALSNAATNAMTTNGNATRGTTPTGQASGENTLKRTATEMSPGHSDASAETSYKRQKLPMTNTIPVDPIEFDQDATLEEVMAKGPILAVQRLGFWKCHLCHTPKYLLAPIGKSPAAPTKWALKDISKMITHFCVMHSEQTVADRLSELGQAFELNRGPFQYWLKTTKNARVDANGNIEGGSSIDEIIETLKAGRMPMALRRFSASAKKMITE